MTQCSSAAEALSRLNGSCSFDILLADRATCKSSSDVDVLLKGAQGLPCIFMAANPSPEDVMAGGCRGVWTLCGAVVDASVWWGGEVLLWAGVTVTVLQQIKGSTQRLAGLACGGLLLQLQRACHTADFQWLLLLLLTPVSHDPLAGVKLGAVDFLAKPLAPQKLRNIWQHTVRKMMCNMNINCNDSAGAASAEELATAAAALGKPRVSMEVILEETDEDLAVAAAVAAAGGKPPAAAASSPSAATTPGSTSGGGSVINYSNGPNMALAIASSFYEPSKGSSAGLSRCNSSAVTSWSPEGSSSPGPDSPVIDRPAKQQHGQHGPVRSCPSTRSLVSAASCHSSWTAVQPASPSSDRLQKQASDAATATAEADSTCDEEMACASGRCATRCMKKAVRHAPAGAAAAAPANAACKPPLAGKPAAAQKPAAGTPASSAGKPAMFSGMPSVPLPTGLGALPQGMVWGMPMCPLVRAPGIVPPANSSAAPQAAGMAMSPWGGMCGMPMFGAMPPAPLMAGGYGGVMPGMPYPAAPAFMGGMAAGMPSGGFSMDPYGQQHMAAAYAHQQWPQAGVDLQYHQQQAAAAMRTNTSAAAGCTAAPTGAAVAAALNASFSAAELLGGARSSSPSAAAAMDVVAEDDAFDFMLGDIAAEDDITDVCGGLLDADLSGIAADTIKMPGELSAEMLALQADLQQQQSAAAAAAAGRCSFESSAAQRQRVSFDCSTASTCTAARASFEASQRCNSTRVSFEVSTRSNRVSFEVNCHNSSSSKAPAAPAATNTHSVSSMAASRSVANLNGAASAPAELLGSVSDLFAACSGDSSHGSGLQHVDSCGMLADLQSLFAASGDSSCPQDCADSALTDSSGLFLDPLDDMPIDGMGMRKNDSFAELINASLPGLAN